MDLGIKGRKAIVCGSSRGLGRGCVDALAAEGCEVLVNGIDAERVEQAAREIRDAGGSVVQAIAADVTTREGRAKLLSAMPDPDILVTNAAGPPPSDFRDVDCDTLHAGIEKNMAAPIALIQAVIDGMVDRGWGRIVNITSSSVLIGIEGLDLSSGARAGLTAFLGGVSRQVARRGVTINHLLPGMFDTDRLHSLDAAVAEMSGVTFAEARAKRLAAIPAGRLGNPAEFGAACAFLCSEQAGYMTGRGILLDGGMVPTNF